ncbi:MAG: hypothetical protein QOE14_744, partial [Humisphaera sp.]|nr:hypothetical protein [Humisphaera sp.]
MPIVAQNPMARVYSRFMYALCIAFALLII